MVTDTFEVFHGGCIEKMRDMDDASVHSIVTDPPYHLESIVKRFGATGAKAAKKMSDGAFTRSAEKFIGRDWDGGQIAFTEDLWREAQRVLVPGGHLVAFSGTKGYHKMATAIESAGFEIRDMIPWIYTSGHPKSHNVAHNARKAGLEGADEWKTWGTMLKPANEPICLARKPLSESSVPRNHEKHGAGGINLARPTEYFPANVITDERVNMLMGEFGRFFLVPKPSQEERKQAGKHPTIKPVSLMRYLCRLVTPSDGIVLDPFMGSGTTGVAAIVEGFRFIGIEREDDYFDAARGRLEKVLEDALRAS